MWQLIFTTGGTPEAWSVTPVLCMLSEEGLSFKACQVVDLLERCHAVPSPSFVGPLRGQSQAVSKRSLLGVCWAL